MNKFLRNIGLSLVICYLLSLIVTALTFGFILNGVNDSWLFWKFNQVIFTLIVMVETALIIIFRRVPFDYIDRQIEEAEEFDEEFNDNCPFSEFCNSNNCTADCRILQRHNDVIIGYIKDTKKGYDEIIALSKQDESRKFGEIL